MGRVSPEYYAKIRARVEDGKIRVGSAPHLELIDYEAAIGGLTHRSQTILRLAMRGWSHQLIADQLGISRSRVSHLVSDFHTSLREGP